jgi:hypothetical protein
MGKDVISDQRMGLEERARAQLGKPAYSVLNLAHDNSFGLV